MAERMSSVLGAAVVVVVVMSSVCWESSMAVPPHHLPTTPATPRDPKFLNLPFLQSLVTVHVQPESCTTATNGLPGVCASSLDCSSQGGKSDGTCFSGFGVCCLYEKTCGETVRTNGTYLVNEGYPESFNDIDNCQYSIYKVNNEVCQLRLDFETLSLLGPDNTTSSCTQDTFSFVGTAGANPTVICGENSGQHMYLDLGAGNGGARVNIATTTRNFSRSWRIRVTQIPCSSASRAPPNCLQYYTEYSGTIRSYNYQNTSGVHQLGGQQYTTCIRTREGFCGIKYMADHFSLSKDGEQTNAETSGDQDCTKDFVLIPSVDKDGTVTGKDRFCGSGFKDLITYSKPFELRLTTDSEEDSNDKLNRGYSIRYTQIPC